jgi:hypothetical protein
VGFSLWRSPEGEIYVTFPSRAFGTGPERRFFDYLRPVNGGGAAAKALKEAIRKWLQGRRPMMLTPQWRAAASACSTSGSGADLRSSSMRLGAYGYHG